MGMGVGAGCRMAVAASTVLLVPILAGLAACSGSGNGPAGAAPSSGKGGAVGHQAQVQSADSDGRHLVLGECFTSDRGTLRGGIQDRPIVRAVACTRSHDAEVFGRFTVPGPAYLTKDDWNSTADFYCANLVPRYDMDSWTLGPSVARVHYFLPTRPQWSAGDHDGVCFWVPASAPTAASLRRDSTTLTADQYAYLDAAQRPESPLAEPPQQKDSNLSDYQNWAGGVADSYTTEVQLLKNHHWPVAAQGPVNALLQRVDALIPVWRNVSQTASLSAIESAVRSARTQTTTAQERAVRAALDLTTTPAG